MIDDEPTLEEYGPPDRGPWLPRLRAWLRSWSRAGLVLEIRQWADVGLAVQECLGAWAVALLTVGVLLMMAYAVQAGRIFYVCR